MWKLFGRSDDRLADLVVAANRRGRLEVFGVAPNQTLWHNWRLPGSLDWSGWQMLGNPDDRLSRLAVAANGDGRLEVFGIGPDWTLWHNWQLGGFFGWSGWHMLGNPDDKLIRLAAATNPDGRPEVFGIGPNLTLWHNWQLPGGIDWSGWQMLGNPDDKLAELTAAANGDGHLEVFGIGPDLTLWHNWQLGGFFGWSGWHMLGNADDRLRTLTVAAAGGVYPGSVRLAAFGVGPDQGVYFNRQISHIDWSGWQRLGRPDDLVVAVDAHANADGRLEAFALGVRADVFHAPEAAGQPGVWDSWTRLGHPDDRGVVLDVAANRDGRLELFLIGTAGDIFHTWQVQPNVWPQRDPITLRADWSGGPLFAIGGWAAMDLHSNGDIVFHGHTHAGGAQNYDYRLTAFLQVPGAGVGIAARHTGRVEGWLSGPDPQRDDLFPADPVAETVNNAMVSRFFNELQFAEGIELVPDYEGSISGTVEEIVDKTIRWTLGSLLIGTPQVAFVVFVGSELLSLAITGSLVPGSRILDGYLWLAGPYGTLIAIPAAAIAEIGDRDRDVDPAAYQFGQTVFGDSLPPRENLRLSPQAGGGGAAFCFPRFDGKIVISHPDVFNNPVDNRVFIHELVHAWQITHAGLETFWLGQAGVTQLCHQAGFDQYTFDQADVDAGRPFGEFGLEQQAEIVEAWYAAHAGSLTDPAALSDPAYKYIDTNIRAKRP